MEVLIILVILGLAIYLFTSKTLFVIAAAFSVLVALAITPTTEESSFRIVAFIIGTSYVALAALWFNNKNREFSFFYSLIAFFLCGAFSIALSTSLLYPIWKDVAYEEVKRGWWIFSTTYIEPTSQITLLIDRTGIIAGPVEEFAKLVAVLIAVKSRIVSRKTGVYYVVLCAIGFAMIENFYYFMKYGEVLPVRANPAHAVFSAIWGAALGSYLAKEKTFSNFLWGLILGMTLHAAWNLFASINSPLFMYIFIFVTLSGLAFIRRELKEKNQVEITATT